MVWVFAVVAIAVLGAAAWAGTGRLGEMPPVVNDRPKGYIPNGSVDADYVAELSLPVAAVGYRRSQVDAVLAARAPGHGAAAAERFDVVARGYDMQAVDRVLATMTNTTAGPDTTVETVQGNVVATEPEESIGARREGSGQGRPGADGELENRSVAPLVADATGDPHASDLRHTE